jgi:hypothetical protein
MEQVEQLMLTSDLLTYLLKLACYLLIFQLTDLLTQVDRREREAREREYNDHGRVVVQARSTLPTLPTLPTIPTIPPSHDHGRVVVQGAASVGGGSGASRGASEQERSKQVRQVR